MSRRDIPAIIIIPVVSVLLVTGWLWLEHRPERVDPIEFGHLAMCRVTVCEVLP